MTLVFCVMRKNLYQSFFSQKRIYINHLFFECCVAKLVWEYISEILGLNIGHDFESVARFWLVNKRHLVTNTVSAAILWSFWKFRMGLKDVFFKIAKMLRRWIPMMQQEAGVRIEEVITQLEFKASMPPLLMWYSQGGHHQGWHHWLLGLQVSALQ